MDDDGINSPDIIISISCTRIYHVSARQTTLATIGRRILDFSCEFAIVAIGVCEFVLAFAPKQIEFDNTRSNRSIR